MRVMVGGSPKKKHGGGKKSEETFLTEFLWTGVNLTSARNWSFISVRQNRKTLLVREFDETIKKNQGGILPFEDVGSARISGRHKRGVYLGGRPGN